MSTTVSNYQLPLLRLLIDRGRRPLPIEEAMELDQRGFRSFLIRKWLSYQPGHGFRLTAEAREAWDRLHHTEIQRQDPTQPLTRYFDYVAYGLADPRQRGRRSRLRVVHKGAA
jgi:hypothetical protein